MNNRFFSGLFLFLSAGASLRAADAEPIQQIGQNVAAIGTNLCSFTESASQLLQSMTLTATNIASGMTALVARFPKTTMLVAASGALYASWRSYLYYGYKQYLDDAKIFLGTVSDDRIPAAGSQVKRIVNLPQSPSQETLNNYISRIEVLRSNLRSLSKLDAWADADPDFATLLDRDHMANAYTDATVRQIEDEYINPRVAALGLPQYYFAIESPWIWLKRIRAPWQAGSNVNPFRSYAEGLIDVYEGEATQLMWQLYKCEKSLRARLVP